MARTLRIALLAASGLVTFCCFDSKLSAQQSRVSFAGKTISVLIGADPGGGADVYARLLSSFYGKFLPGEPRLVARNIPNAAGLELANRLYNTSPKDGSEIGTFLTETALKPLFGDQHARFQTTRFTWIGNMLDSDVTACIAGKLSGIKSWSDLKGKTATFGASGPTTVKAVQTRAVGALLGVKTKVVEGYSGTGTSLLALRSGELDAMCGLYLSTIVSQFKADINDGTISVWMTFGRERSKEFPAVPTIYDFIHSDSDRELVNLIFGQEELGRPFVAPPDLPSGVTSILRQSFIRTVNDPEFLKIAENSGLSIHAVDGERTQSAYDAFYKTPRSVIDRAKVLMGVE
jgi:tripartite-type tricarboxylate transporter receptor subunit TctC